MLFAIGVIVLNVFRLLRRWLGTSILPHRHTRSKTQTKLLRFRVQLVWSRTLWNTLVDSDGGGTLGPCQGGRLDPIQGLKGPRFPVWCHGNGTWKPAAWCSEPSNSALVRGDVVAGGTQGTQVVVCGILLCHEDLNRIFPHWIFEC